MLPILLDDFTSFCIVLLLCFGLSAMGATLGCLYSHRSGRGLIFKSTLHGTIAAIASFVVLGLGYLAKMGDDAIKFGMIRLWATPIPTNQGAIGIAWERIISLAFICFLACIAFFVAHFSTVYQKADGQSMEGQTGLMKLRWSLRQWMVVFLFSSIALGSWAAIRRKSIVFESEQTNALSKWKPYGLSPMVARDGQIYLLDRAFGSPALALSADAIIEMAKSQRLESLNLSKLSLPEDCFKILGAAPRLHVLDLSGTNVTDEMLQDIAKLKVRLLYLNDTQVSDAGLQSLAPLMAHPLNTNDRRSVSLHVLNTKVTQAGISKLKASGKAMGGTWFVNGNP
jgi:hypothetical protein